MYGNEERRKAYRDYKASHAPQKATEDYIITSSLRAKERTKALFDKLERLGCHGLTDSDELEDMLKQETPLPQGNEVLGNDTITKKKQDVVIDN